MELFTFDDEYVRRLREGDRLTEEHFSNYFTQHLRITLSGRLPSHSIDDVTQEVLFRFYAKLRSPEGGIRDGRKLGSYVTSICKYRLFEIYRDGKSTEPLTDEHANRFTSSEDTVKRLVDTEEREHVRNSVAKLPKKDRDILRAIFFDERAPADVRREFGVEPGYLRVLIHRAKKKFREGWPEKKPN